MEREEVCEFVNKLVSMQWTRGGLLESIVNTYELVVIVS